MEGVMPDKKSRILRIYRLMTPKHQADLLAWVHLAHVAENSARKSLGFEVLADSVSSIKLREYSCSNNLRRRKR
jgi:hypothetical protein